MKIKIRNTQPEDFSQIIELSKEIYHQRSDWTENELASHLEVFPQGQFVAVEEETQKVVGMAASLIVFWEDYNIRENWEDFTANGMFTNHDAEKGRTLYGAEVMVSPTTRRKGVGKKLYKARRKLVEELDLLRIRAGSRLRHYHLYANKFSATEYVNQVIEKRIKDPTLTFQLREGFRVLAVVSGYLPDDKESLGKAAIIEWKNPKINE